MKKSYLFVILCLFSWAIKSQNKHAEEFFKRMEQNSSVHIPKTKIQNDCIFFGGDTLEGFPLNAEIDELIKQNEDYTELKLTIKKKEIDFVKSKYKIAKLPFELNERIETFPFNHQHNEITNSLLKNGPPSTQASTCNNIDFEDGTFNGWIGYEGNNQNSNAPLTTVTGPITPPTNANSPETSCNYFSLVNTGVDPWSFVSIPSPLGGWCARLGGENRNVGNASNATCGYAASNSLNNTAGEVLEKTFVVTTANTGFQYSFLFIYADNGTHTVGTQPYFKVEVLDQSNNVINCLNYYQQGQNGVAPNGYSGSVANGYFYTPAWVTSSLNLLPYLGQNVTIRFTVAGCTQTAHFGYAYVDCACSPLELLLPTAACVGGNATITAPPQAGGSFSWAGPSITAGGSSQTATVNGAGTYSVTITNANGCSYELDTTVVFYPLPTVTVNSPTTCPGVPVVLNANSTGGAGTLSYTWSPSAGLSVTNDSTTTATINATTSYTVTGISVHSCSNSAVATITIPATPPPTFSAPPVCLGATTIVNNTTGGAGIFSWNFGDGSAVVVNQNSPTHTYTTTGNFVITCTINVSGCTATNTVTAVVNPSPTVTVNSFTICNGAGPVTLVASGATSYSWNTGATGANLSVNPTTTTNYTVTGSTAASCTSVATTAVTVIQNPTITPTGDLVCFGVTANLSATGANTYSWAGSNLVTTTGSNVTANPTATSNYTVTGTLNTCTATAIVTVTVTPNPTVTVSSSSVCPGVTATITATSSSSGTTYSWNGPNLVSTVGGTVTADPLTTSDYTVIGTAATCTGTAIGTVTVMPSLTVTVTSGTMCAGAGPVTFTASGGNTYTWSTGPTGSTLSVSPATTTSYTVTGSTAAGCTNTAVAAASVTPNPTVTATGSQVCSGVTANLSANGATTYTWTGPNLLSNNASNVTADPSTTSLYTVTGTANTCTASAITTITVDPTPTVTVVNMGPYCPGDAVPAASFTNNPNDPNTTYVWMNNNPAIGLAGAGSGYPGGFTAEPNGTLANMYGVVTVTPTLNGCVGTPQNYTITVKPTPIVNHIPNKDYCPAVNSTGIVFTAQPGGPTTFAWINTNNAIGLSSSGTGNIPSFLTVNATPGNLVSTVHVVPTLNGCVGPDSSFVITIYPLPTPAFDYSRACVGDVTKLFDESTVATGQTIIYWDWDFNADGVFYDATNQNPQVTLTPAGPHQIGLEVTTNKGCKNQVYETVYVNPLPTPALVGDQLAGCPNLPVLFTDMTPANQGIVSWSWTFGNGQTSIAQNPTVVVYHNGSPVNSAFYDVTLTVKTDSGCSATITKPSYITVYPKPSAGFDYTPYDVDILDPTVYVHNSSVGANGNLPIQYYMGDVFIDHFDTANWSTLTNPIHTYNDQEAYTYNITQWVQNIYGCKDSVTHPVVINPIYTFYIPNAYSPNGDGRNEGFKGTGIGIDPDTYNIWVFDRWGNLIFHTTNMEETWNGTVNERQVQEDVYVWKVRFKDVTGTKHELHGHVSLIR